MGYRCQLCKQPVPTGTARMVHVVKRRDGSISRELAVCQLCRDRLACGETVATMLPQKPKLEPPMEVAPVRVFGQPPSPPKGV